jgi:hypothetical protein
MEIVACIFFLLIIALVIAFCLIIASMISPLDGKKRLALVFGGLALLAVIVLAGVIGPEVPEIITHRYYTRSKVKTNMHSCQLAAEDYAKSHSGCYPKSVDDKEFRSYFPGGHPPDKSGAPLVNPITGVSDWPITGTVTNIKTSSTLPPIPIGKGIVEYSVIYDNEHRPTNYAIRGGDETGMTIQGLNGTLVLHKH